MKRFKASRISKPMMLVLIAASAFGARTVFSQGTVFFANVGTFTTPADRRVYDPITCVPLVGTDWVAALYFGITPDAITELAVRNHEDITLLGAIGRFRAVEPDHSSAGTWVGGIRTLPGVTVGQMLTMQVRVWDLSEFATFDDARAMGGYALESASFSYQVPHAEDAFGAKLNNFLGITPPECIPEPSVYALWTLGVGVLLAWRYKNPKRRPSRMEQ